MEKFNKFFIANLKRTAQMVSPMVREKNKLMELIAESKDRIEVLNTQIESLDNHIRKECGYGVEDLIERRVINTGKLDKDGNPVKITKWELKYPETIVPVVNGDNVENTNNSENNSENNINFAEESYNHID